MSSEEVISDQIELVGLKNLPQRVRLPGFVGDQVIGFGDVIKRATSAIGIRPCGGCEQRSAWLNRRLVISPWRRR